MGESRHESFVCRLGSGIVNKPTVGWHDVLASHVVPSAIGNGCTFIIIMVAIAQVEVGEESLADGRTFGHVFA